MDARLVWDTWRRVLTEDDLVAWIADPGGRAENSVRFDGDERKILDDYASTPAATEQNIYMYRRGLVRNGLGALNMVPLTRRILRASGLDLDEIAEMFARSSGYRDYGPNFWSNAADFVAFLAPHPEFASPARQDVIAIDTATIALARRLGVSAPPVWPDRMMVAGAGHEIHWDTARFIANPAAVIVRSSCDISAWIENPFAFDPAVEPEASSRHWLIYFPAAEAAHEYAELSERCARVFSTLATPSTAAEVSAALGDLSLDDVRGLVGSLTALGVVGPATEVRRSPLSRRTAGAAAP